MTASPQPHAARRTALRPCATPGCPGTTREGRYCVRCSEPMNRPLAACARVGCPRTTRERWCDEHAAEAAARATRTRGEDSRASAARRGYDADWRRLRQSYLRAHPRCALCGAVATQVDHVVPLRAGGANRRANLRALCAPCHSRKTVRHDGGFGRASARRRSR